MGITDSGTPGTEFLGLIPVEDGGLSWIMPVLAGLSAVAMGCTQNLINPLQKEQTRLEKNTTNGLSIALSFFLGMFVAAGMAFYWICSNLLSILVQIACNIIIKPAKYIDYDELNASREELEGLNAIGKKQTKWYQRDPLTKREKTDFKRFFSIAGKHIVFYSEGSGFYKYFKGAIEWLLAHSDICIHYVTNDPNDQAFALAETQPRLFPYYIGEKRAITLMMKMDADVVVTTLGDLDNFYIKRSYVRRDIEYVYMFHHMTSMDMTSTEGEYDNYDTLLCTGPHQITEMRQIENVKGVAPKNLVECGYNLLDEEIADYEARPELHVANERPIILIAPSWQEDNIMDSCIDPMLASGTRTRLPDHRAPAPGVHQALPSPVGRVQDPLRRRAARGTCLRGRLQRLRFHSAGRPHRDRLVVHLLRVLLHHLQARHLHGHAPEGAQPQLQAVRHRFHRRLVTQPSGKVHTP